MEKTAKEKLLLRLPKSLHERVSDFCPENGLIDDCKYMLLFNEGFSWDGYESLPCKTIKEAKEFVKNSEKK